MIALTRPACPRPVALERRDYTHKVNKEALRQSTAGKCMYCEAKIEDVSYAHVEHIKPKAPDKFPELEFVWDNHGFSCQVCNTTKSDKYDDATPFINPYNENPEDHIIFIGNIANSKQGSERGEYTIQEISLNRPALIDRRKEKLDNMDKIINAAYRTQNPNMRNQAIDSLKEYAESDQEFSAMVKSVLVTHEIL
jgi:uncharacterized protein (TIGR02646 family)